MNNKELSEFLDFILSILKNHNTPKERRYMCLDLALYEEADKEFWKKFEKEHPNYPIKFFGHAKIYKLIEGELINDETSI